MNSDTVDYASNQPNQADNNPLVVKSSSAENKDEQQKYFSFTDCKVHLQRLVDDWKQEIADTEIRRKERKIEINVENLRNTGQLDEDETLIPIRVIDTNISRELVPFINYLKNSRRICIFECLDDPDQDTDLIEQAFTKCATYTAWEIPHHKCIDGTAHHGWDAVEVVYDESKPGGWALEQVGHDKLYFPRSAIDIQYSPFIIRAYDVTILQLQKFVSKFGFDPAQTDIIRKQKANSQKEKETIRIYKQFFKSNGVVYVSWFSLEGGTSDWLKQPVKHYVGIDEQGPGGQWQPSDLQYYPIFLNIYKLNEESPIVAAKGRGFLDCYKQEALTALWSAYVNGMNRASGIYASPKMEDGTGASLKELENLKLSSGRFLNRPVEFWAPPYPSSDVLKTLQFASVQNDDENNQVNFAAMNREDSRKTAKEIGAAQQQQQLLNSVQLTLFSTYIRQVYNFCWLITQSQALQNKIVFLPKQQQIPVPNPINPGAPIPDPQNPQQPLMRTIFTNDFETIDKKYSLRAAGDVDVIQKDEILQKMRVDFNLISQTSLKDQFILDYIRLSYPESADKYAQALAQGQMMTQMKGLINRLAMYFDAAVKDHPEMLKQLPQEQQSAVAQDLQMASQLGGNDVTSE